MPCKSEVGQTRILSETNYSVSHTSQTFRLKPNQEKCVRPNIRSWKGLNSKSETNGRVFSHIWCKYYIVTQCICIIYQKCVYNVT